MSKKITFFLAFLFTISTYSQIIYSERTLTGKGELELIGSTIKLQEEVYVAFEKMKKAALNEGIHIQIVSGYRSFEHQKSIWNKKYMKLVNKGLSPKKAIDKIIEYSTFPGTSRHHWGTEIDIIDGYGRARKSILAINNYLGNGVYSKMKRWMDVNAEKFGFYLVYNNVPHRKGFKYEPWHYSYKPISKTMLSLFLKVDLGELLSNPEIKGYNYINEVFINKYLVENVLSINPLLK